jgi:alpha-galactosidase
VLAQPGDWSNNRQLVLTFAAMATAGGTFQVRFCAGFLAMGLAALGCGDRHLTAILPAGADRPPTPPDTTPDPTPDSCSGPASAPLPPLGWNGWNAFRCRPELDQTKFQANVDALVARGLKDAGYEYANLDDCWQAPRGTNGVLAANARFPDGVSALGRYVHARGLKLGIDVRNAECVRPELTTPSSAGHETEDAATLAGWGVDYVKYTRCGGDDAEAQASFGAMGAALAKTQRPMLFALNTLPFKYWQTQVGDQRRTHTDIEPTWENVLDIIDTNTKLAAYSGQGGFNDADMLWVGLPGLSAAESRAHFSMWAIMASPLLAGNDLSEMSDETAALLTNREIIALDQDALGLQGVLLEQQGDVGVYAKPLSACGARGVVLLNRGEQAADASVTWQALGLAPGVAGVRDLWAAQDLNPAQDTLTLSVPPHDVRVLRITGTEPALPRGTVYVSDLPWSYAANSWGPVERDQELGDKLMGDGQPLMLGGKRYAKGLGTNSQSLVRYRLGKACQTFSADIGIDDLTGDIGSAVFQVWADAEKIFDSGVMYGNTPPRHIDVDVTGKSELRLLVGEVEDFGLDHGDWADAQLTCND